MRLWGRRVCWWWGVGTVDVSTRPLCWRLSRVRWSRFCGFVSRIAAARVYGITPARHTVVAAGNRVGGMLWMRGVARSRVSQARLRV